LETLKARASVTEFVIATDKGANAFNAVALLREELSSQGFPADRTSSDCHKVNLIAGAFTEAIPGRSSGHRLLDEVKVVRSLTP
jgi:hypothetical protein